MEESLYQHILEEAKKSASKYQDYHNYLHLEYNRNCRRLLSVNSKEVKIPEEWSFDKKYNPFYVVKHAKKIARSIALKIKNKTYRPIPAREKTIPKKGGGTRTISIYQIPDSAVSDKIYHDLLRKNKHRFSSFAYAYRNDRNIHFAIQDIANELKKSPRIFIAEFDFSNFFGSIKHDYIYQQIDQNCFQVSNTDRQIITSFLADRNGVGIPLGTSVSLFLANLACWQLDRKLEDEGLRFARYADDTIIWTKDYTKICNAFNIINEFSSTTGIKINYSKSDGISLLKREDLRSEFSNSKNFIEFLGYKISVDAIGIKSHSVQNIKKQISYLLYKNLIQPINGTPIKARNFPTVRGDQDFLSAILQIRRYLYGSLSEQTLKKYLNGTYLKLNFKGIMSFYPLIDDENQMKELDRWLVSTILNTLRKRKKLLEQVGFPVAPNFPYNLNGQNIISVCENQMLGNKKGVFQIPSFFRIYRAIQLGVKNEGIEHVMHPNSNYYED